MLSERQYFEVFGRQGFLHSRSNVAAEVSEERLPQVVLLHFWEYSRFQGLPSGPITGELHGSLRDSSQLVIGAFPAPRENRPIGLEGEGLGRQQTQRAIYTVGPGGLGARKVGFGLKGAVGTIPIVGSFVVEAEVGSEDVAHGSEVGVWVVGEIRVGVQGV